MCATHTSRYRSTRTNPFSKFMSSRQKVAIRRSSCSSGSAACQQCRSTFFRETRFFRRSNASASPSVTSASVTATARSAGSVARRSASTSEKLPCAKLRMFFLVTSKGHSPSTDAAKHARACVSHASASLASTHAASGIAGAIEARGRRTSTRRATLEVKRTRIFRRFFHPAAVPVGGRQVVVSQISSRSRERDDRQSKRVYRRRDSSYAFSHQSPLPRSRAQHGDGGVPPVLLVPRRLHARRLHLGALLAVPAHHPLDAHALQKLLASRGVVVAPAAPRAPVVHDRAPRRVVREPGFGGELRRQRLGRPAQSDAHRTRRDGVNLLVPLAFRQSRRRRRRRDALLVRFAPPRDVIVAELLLVVPPERAVAELLGAPVLVPQHQLQPTADAVRVEQSGCPTTRVAVFC
mmetsp:Transcript_6506/g.26366  ORF Transcript_6506/g.26366 Transcript_6506/m.26366 type:complete len:407 (+) Transcript_6506:2057-3277(+)